MAYPPFNKPGRKPAFSGGVARPKPRYKCMDCGAEFVDGRDDDKVFVHAKRTKYHHIGFIKVPSASYDRSMIKRLSYNWKESDDD